MQDIIERFVSPSGRPVRVVVRDGDLWFVAKDVADELGYTDAAQMTRWLDDDEYIKLDVRNLELHVKKTCNSGTPLMTFLNESGLYHAALRSRMPKAKAFRRWVTHEVIPSIRKHGAYMTPKTARNIVEHPDDAVALVSPKVAMALPEALEEFVTSVVSQAVEREFRKASEYYGNVRRLERENEDLKMELEELRHDAEAYRRWLDAWKNGMNRWRASKADPGQTRLWDDDRELLGEVR